MDLRPHDLSVANEGTDMKEYKFWCFGCNDNFYREVQHMNDFTNKSGTWKGVQCKCGSWAKHIGERSPAYNRSTEPGIESGRRN